MKRLDHPNIISLVEVFEETAAIYLVMKHCDGGLLFDSLNKLGKKLDDRVAAVCFVQILRGVNFMHKQRVCHRGLCPDVLRLQDKVTNWNDIHVCICDFAQAGKIDKNADVKFTDTVVTNDYSAPQLMEGKTHTELCDSWSCGAILCTITCGKPPKCDATHRECTLPKSRLDGYKLSKSLTEYLSYLLKEKEKDRATPFLAINHPWAMKGEKAQVRTPLQIRQVEHMKMFSRANKLKKVAMHVVARGLTGAEVHDLTTRFEWMDRKNTGHITYSELKTAMKAILQEGGNSWREVASSPIDINEMLREMDVNGDREISYSEFLASTLDQKYYTTPASCWSAFSAFDADGNGSISREEIQQILARDVFSPGLQEDLKTIEEEADIDDGEEIEFDHFVKMMSSDNKNVCRPRDMEAVKNSNDQWAFTAHTSPEDLAEMSADKLTSPRKKT